ncbi:hypothetical protein [Glutamicibacter sp. BW77]|uniref:hypothetical protein n=1 Tax=Glutamicibacter sp. BW77 TaxID=2024402 RepID=UPI000BB99BFC|nr:hypothetical protein [Glutamicibacter sp. BW77]PCC37438.1 hypothetical protein CIK74_00525 [Glutamicibacter sp. BW77]
MSSLPGNPYGTASNISPHEGERDGDWVIAQATLALAYEQRTIALIAFAQLCVTIDGTGVNLHSELGQINARLGLGNTK